MLNKKLVLGSLAGATLLVGAVVLAPTSASAQGLMQGTCVNCHTMHNSQNGTAFDGTTAPNQQLLRFAGCVGCHTGNDNSASGKGGATNAPQVGNGAAAPANALAGGFFDTDIPENAHSITGSISGMAANTVALTVGPGGTFTVALDQGFNCEDCHGEAKGAHHSYTAAGSYRDGSAQSYRMLRADKNNDGTADGVLVQGTGDNTWEAGAGANAITAATMNSFCGDCHGTFHTATGSAGAWVRHPIDVNTTTYGATFGGSKLIPTGTGGTNNSQVMCISCHRAHGSAEGDLLRFSYSSNSAGDYLTGTGCETCHGQK